MTFIRLFVSSRTDLLAENLFLRKQLALFQKRKAKPRRATRTTRLAMLALARFFHWRDALVVADPFADQLSRIPSELRARSEDFGI